MQGGGEDLVRIVASMPLFSDVGMAAIAAVAGASCLRHAAPKEAIYWQGDPTRAFYHVLSGHVRRAIISTEGDEKLIDVIAAGQHFGLAELFGGARYASSAETVEAALLLEIGRDGMLPAVAANSALSLRVLADVAAHQLAFEQEVAATYFHSGCRRLLDYLLRLAGTDLDGAGDKVVVLPISKGLLAEHLGMTAETLSRSFRDLVDAGFLSVHGKRITLLAKLGARRHAAERAADAAPSLRKRRRTDPWVDNSTLAQPLGSRAWL